MAPTAPAAPIAEQGLRTIPVYQTIRAFTKAGVNWCAWSEDGKRLVTQTDASELHLWGPNTPAGARALASHDKENEQNLGNCENCDSNKIMEIPADEREDGHAFALAIQVA
jgi:hypothetical protein